tara:strand:- start:17468 stop:17788 length:321 start_codon:yes stop_codon:yes gene_type:complete
MVPMKENKEKTKRQFKGFKAGVISLRSNRKFKNKVTKMVEKLPYKEIINDLEETVDPDDEVYQMHIKALVELSKEADEAFEKMVENLEKSYNHSEILVRASTTKVL